MRFLAAVAAAAVGCASLGASAQQIDGAGATFPAPVYTKWGEAAQSATGLKLNYQAIGSGGGAACSVATDGLAGTAVVAASGATAAGPFGVAACSVAGAELVGAAASFTAVDTAAAGPVAAAAAD